MKPLYFFRKPRGRILSKRESRDIYLYEHIRTKRCMTATSLAPRLLLSALGGFSAPETTNETQAPWPYCLCTMEIFASPLATLPDLAY